MLLISLEEKALWLSRVLNHEPSSPSTPSRGLAASHSSAVCPHPTGGEWRLKYERAVREVDFTKKRLQQEFEDKLEVEQQSKRQLERRVRLVPERYGEGWTPHVGVGNGQ